jgi:elongation factor G
MRPLLLVETAIEPKIAADRKRLLAALAALAAEDRSLAVSADGESGEIILKGVSEQHLDGAIDALRHTHQIEVNVGAPQVAYRETLTGPVDIDYTHAKQAGGAGVFARVRLRFEPLPPGSGFIFQDDVSGGAVPKACIPGVEKGLIAANEVGVLAGFPVIDFKATLMDGAYHEIDSNAGAFETAARAAFRQLKERKAVKLLEPVMKVEVVTPDEFAGSVTGDLTARRGSIETTDRRGDRHVVAALVPLSNMLGYANALNSLTRGRGQFTMSFDHYDDVWRGPGNDDDPGRFPPAAAMRA